jgi:hypothetical protein
MGEFREGRLVLARAFADADGALRYIRERRDGTVG